MKNKKIWISLGFVSVLLLLYFFTPAKDYLKIEKLELLKSWVLGMGSFAPVIYVALYAAATILCLPGSILTLAAGALFGTWLGTLYVIVASNLGASGAFLIARFLGQDVATRLLRGKLSKLEGGIEKNGFQLIFGLRLLPVVPFSAFNYAAGLSPVKWKDYFFGSLLGMLPGTFVYVSLGNVVNSVSLTDPSVWLKPEVWGPFALVIGFTVVMRVIKGLKDRKPPSAGKSESRTEKQAHVR